MSSNLTVTYKGSTIHTASNTGSATLKTGGAWCEGDIGLSYTFESVASFLILVSSVSGATVTAEKDSVTYNGIETTAGEYEITVPEYGTYTVTAAQGTDSGTVQVTIAPSSVEIGLADPVLENNTWAKIQEISSAGLASSVWSVGDVKSIALSGKCGSLTVDTTLYCYIIGFDHNSSIEGTGISFGTWRNAAVDGKNVCLCNEQGTTAVSGNKIYNINHWGSSSSPFTTNYGGWKGCDLRYDILGSTRTAPSGYGSTPTTSRTGYDAPNDTATNPVSNTLMSCLPSALRSVMKYIIKYTDNKGNSSKVAANVTSSRDFLPLMAEYEIFGVRTDANQYEQSYQAQYSYYALGNSKIKYNHSSIGTAIVWWERSPTSTLPSAFCAVQPNGTANSVYVHGSYGLSPVFMV